METLPPRLATIRTLSNEESIRLDSNESVRRYTRENCPTCAGKKQFRWYDAARVNIMDFECSCYDQWVTYRYLLNAGIGLNYQRMGWADLLGVSGEILQNIGDFLEDPEPWIQRGRGWFLYGPFGTGKTLIANLMLKNLLGAGYDGYFTTFNDMMTNFKSSWNSAEDRRWFYRRIKNTGILIIDDPGRENTNSTIAEPMLDEVIRHRVSACRPTFITTNHTLDSFELRYGANIASLLLESSRAMEVVGQDFRQAKLARDDEELKLKLTRPIVLA